MRTSLLFALLLLNAGLIKAQCNPSIPSSATPILNNMTTLSFGESWVCQDILVTDNNSANVIYLEDNASLNCFGCTATIYAKAGATVNIYSSGTPTVYHVSSATILDVSGLASVTPCTSLTYDYTNAPAGCIAGVGIEEYQSNIIQVYPNPSPGNLTLKVSEELGKEYHVSIMSIDGAVLKNYRNNKVQLDLNLSDLPSGYYILRFESDDHTILEHKTFVIH